MIIYFDFFHVFTSSILMFYIFFSICDDFFHAIKDQLDLSIIHIYDIFSKTAMHNDCEEL